MILKLDWGKSRVCVLQVFPTQMWTDSTLWLCFQAEPDLNQSAALFCSSGRSLVHVVKLAFFNQRVFVNQAKCLKLQGIPLTIASSRGYKPRLSW